MGWDCLRCGGGGGGGGGGGEDGNTCRVYFFVEIYGVKISATNRNVFAGCRWYVSVRA